MTVKHKVQGECGHWIVIKTEIHISPDANAMQYRCELARCIGQAAEWHRSAMKRCPQCEAKR